jgi:hypothetical protein
MKTIKLALIAVAALGTISIGGATAMPFSDVSAALGKSQAQDVRVICDRYRRCHNTNRAYRYAQPNYAPGYYVAPGYGYYGAPAYRYYGAPGVGIGVGPFGLRVW